MFAEGSDAVVRCPAFLGDPPSASIVWTYENNSRIPTNDKFTPQNQTLTIRDIRTEDTVLKFNCAVLRESDKVIVDEQDITVQVVPLSEYISKIVTACKN